MRRPVGSPLPLDRQLHGTQIDDAVKLLGRIDFSESSPYHGRELLESQGVASEKNNKIIADLSNLHVSFLASHDFVNPKAAIWQWLVVHCMTQAAPLHATPIVRELMREGPPQISCFPLVSLSSALFDPFITLV